MGKNNDISDIVENLSTSTNNVLIKGLLERGIDEVYQFNSSSIRLNKSGSPITDAVKLKLIRINERKKNYPILWPLAYGDVACSFSKIIRLNLNEFDVIFIRGDDFESDSNIIEVYDEVQNPLFINSPEGTLVAKDKFEIKARARKVGIKIPPTYNVVGFQELLNALRKIPGKYKVIKARYGFGGKQVWRVTSDTKEIKLWRIFERCDGEAVVQKYEPIIEKGDLRLNIFDGKVVGDGAILRQAGPGKWQTNIDLGGSHKPYRMNENIKRVAKKVSKAYPEVRLQGIDLLLDGAFIETNAFPTTLGYTQKHFGIKARDIVLDKIEEIPNNKVL